MRHADRGGVGKAIGQVVEFIEPDDLAIHPVADGLDPLVVFLDLDELDVQAILDGEELGKRVLGRFNSATPQPTTARRASTAAPAPMSSRRFLGSRGGRGSFGAPG